MNKKIKLYSSLAHIYHEMYKQILFMIYDSYLKQNNCKKVIEIGCGTGLLGMRLINAGYDYLGVDLYNEMLEIARKETNSDRFIQGDMRNLKLVQSFDCAMITGRSIGYVTTNPEIISTFIGINHFLRDKGLFIFDSFDANKIFENFKEESEQVIHSGNRTITRKNILKKNLTTGWTWDFMAKYIIEENNEAKVYEDFSTLRAFTVDEISLFLKLTGFNLLEVVQDNVLTIVAEKIKEY
jgi:SAM-dependent methyltransferase